MAGGFTVLEVFNSEVEAEMSRAQLEASGIEAFVSKDDAGGMRPHLQLSQGVRLLVSPEDVEVAKEILHKDGSNQESDLGKTETWQCTGCGEILEAQFTECWQCGTSRSGG
jgi:hypothetical protein